MRRNIVSALSALALLVLVTGSLMAWADSHVRIVRLSSVEGQVQMDRATGEGLEKAILNAPVVEGTRIVTGSDGLAEVEFENQSALRLTEDSEVRFSQLLMNDAGAKINQIEIVKGLVYLDAASKGEDVYRLMVGDSSFLVHRNSEVRLSVTPEQIKLAVLKGDAQLEKQPQAVNVGKKETLTIDRANAANYALAKDVEPVRFDAWNKEREDYGKAYAANEGYGGPDHAYGLQDLNYYGDFFYAPGYGYAWQPYGFANAMMGWNPYSYGAWMFYPGFGYAWASAYPWGWLPYHYGSWAFINGAGWAWIPGRGYNGQWYGSSFQTVPRITNAPAGWAAPAPPAVATNAGSPTFVVGKPGATATIPGGRIPPNFASVVPGRAVAANATNNFAKPNAASAARSHAVFAPHSPSPTAAHSGPHVFAPPRAAAVGSGGHADVFEGRSGAAVSGRAVGSSSSSSGSHASTGAAHK
ncbi:MAG TPA: FecR family protein [Terriglobales bacterium]|nr:FecR family protein [Terriglobales bacterium]